MKVSDYIIQFFENMGVTNVFCVTGGPCAHLIESVRTSKLTTVFNFHEQACSMAADAYARISKIPAMVLVTNGPGATNALTGVIGAWQDSIPMIVISGQISRNHTMINESRNVRQLGSQEVNIIPIVQHCTNFSVQIHDVQTIPNILRAAWRNATTGRMGPVWIDVPIDIQSSFLNLNDIRILENTDILISSNKDNESKDYVSKICNILTNAVKPLIIVGNGVHLSNTEEHFKKFIEKLKIPVIATWNASDLFNHTDKLYVGNFGLFGERAANIAVQESDAILILGSRLSIPCIGFNTSEFSKNSIKIMVDIDDNELNKGTLNIDVKCKDDLHSFFEEMLNIEIIVNIDEWSDRLKVLKGSLSVFNEPHTRSRDGINSYDLIKHLGNCIKQTDAIITDMGTSFTCTMQSLRNVGNRLFTSSAMCSMGFGLPGAIGAWMSGKPKRVICIAGDGGFQMNIQELQTIVSYNIPIKMIILNNGGYLAVGLMQDNLFKHRFGADVGSPNFCAIASAYGIRNIKLTCDNDICKLDNLLEEDGPVLIEINMVKDQLIIPRVMSHVDKSSGQIKSGKLESMYPPLN